MSEETKVGTDLLGLKSYGDAVNTVTKGLVDGIGAFLSKLCMPSVEEIGFMLRDRISMHRLKNLNSVIKKTQALIEDKREPITGELDVRALQMIAENASLVEEETLQTMWAGLLAGGAIKDGATDDLLLYADILKSLTVFQGKILNLIYGDKRIAEVVSSTHPSDSRVIESDFEYVKRSVFALEKVLSLHPDSTLEQMKAITFDKRFVSGNEVNAYLVRRFQMQFASLEAKRLIASWKLKPEHCVFGRSLEGLDFYMRCSGDCIYPLGAYLVERARRDGVEE